MERGIIIFLLVLTSAWSLGIGLAVGDASYRHKPGTPCMIEIEQGQVLNTQPGEIGRTDRGVLTCRALF